MEKIQDQERLATLIHQWNQDHYDIFELSRPNENLEFHGVVRFYFQDGANVVTKCIRVASTASTKEVVDVLIEKFRPDMRMLTRNSYALYEVHVNGDERRLLDNEKVLFVQLNWGKDVREGRFLLKQEGVPTISAMDKENTGTNKTFTRKLSKREKKEKKKQDKQKQKDHGGGLADKLYTDMPESKFTRSISNPEAVMKRRRQMKVEKKLQQCRGQDGQGGTLKIYGETLRPDIPYKTLLLSTGDDVEYVIKEALEKYDLDKEDPSDFCLFQVLVPTGEREYHGGAIGQERVMESHECPLGIAMRFPPSEGTVMFQLKRRPADAKKTKHKKIRAVSHEDLRPTKDTIPPHQLPYLVELNPDGSDNPKGKVYRLNMKFTEVGTDRNMLIQLHGPNVQPRHCVIGLTQSDGIVTITPKTPESETIVNNQRIQETTTLRHGMTLRFGKLNVFKFMDPHFEEKMRKGQMPMDFQQKRPGPQHQSHPKLHETNFDVDGKVESQGSSSPRGSDRGPEPMEVQQKRPPPANQVSPRDMVDGRPPPSRQEDALPAVLEFREDKEDIFLRSVILEINSSGTQFKLAPTYTSYMAVRYCISGGYRPDMSPHDRAHRVTGLVNNISNLVHQAVQNNRDNPVALALWMANASEILNFFKQDHDIHPFSLEAQEILAESVQLAFHHLVNYLQYDLQRTMTAFLDENDAADDDEMGEDRQRYSGKPTVGDVLDTLSSAMNLVRRCRVNAALTIQLFSQLFHYVNMWLFNVLVTEKRVQFCTRSWGMRLKRRLGRVEAWAEKQGLELAADCHLCRIIQAAHLLEAPKTIADDIVNICSTCFKLNSLQLRELLQQYIPEPNEPPIPQNFIDQVVRVAENMEDEKIKSDGRDVRLEEDPDLQLPFLFPEDGYSCDKIRGIPNGLGEFVEPLARAGVCRMVAQPGSSGEWTVYMHVDDANIEQGQMNIEGNSKEQSTALSNNETVNSLPNTTESAEKKDKDIQLPWLVDGREFHRMLSHGKYRSYENRLSLGGPCRAGKSTLASVLIGEQIPLQWNSTDGLVIYFGRNGIDIEKKKMIPFQVGERGHEVLAKILRGTPNVGKEMNQKTRQETTANARKDSTDVQTNLTYQAPTDYTQINNETPKYSTDQFMTTTLHSITNSEGEDIRRQVSTEDVPSTVTEIETLDYQKLQLQSSILEEVRNGQYRIKIAPSDLIDFGGQKSYDMTHQLFIQHRGSFLLMFDGRFGLHKQLDEYSDGVTAASILKHWVGSVLAYNEDTEDIMPMILFAATHRDQCEEDVEKLRVDFIQDIKKMFSHHEQRHHIHLDNVFFINGIDNNDVEIQHMTKQIVLYAMQQSSWGQLRPMQWVPLELQISNIRMKNVNIITKEDLRNVNMLNADLALTEDQLNDFLLVQHSLGKLMYYNLPGLDNFIIIHPPALVNILRSFVTDEQFFPDEKNLKTILQKIKTTGKILKTDLLKLWKQDQFQQYMQDDSIKDFVIQLLVHLDILVIPKASEQVNSYLVPCMIKSTRPLHFNSTENQEGTTICLRYTIARQSIPTSLAYKIIGSSLCVWPLKYEDSIPCLYHKAALVNVSQDNELRIWIEDNHVMVVMTNQLALLYISPDVAASIQECLTKNLESSLLFHQNSFGKQMKPTEASELYTIEVGVPCGQEICYISLQDAIMQDKWICGRNGGKETNHDTRYLRYWTFDKRKIKCGPECKGLNNNEIRTEPSDKHLVRLGSQIGIRLFEEFFINLKMDKKKWESIEYTYAGHSPEGIMSMALMKWKECKLEDREDPSLYDLSEALKAIDLDTHAICQAFRENINLPDIVGFKLLETPEDDVLKALSNQIGNCALHLGIELGVSFHKLQSSFIKYPKDLPGLFEEIFKIWKTKSKVPTYHSLMVALKRVNGGGVTYLSNVLS